MVPLKPCIIMRANKESGINWQLHIASSLWRVDTHKLAVLMYRYLHRTACWGIPPVSAADEARQCVCSASTSSLVVRCTCLQPLMTKLFQILPNSHSATTQCHDGAVPVRRQTGVQCDTTQLHCVMECHNCPCDVQATRCWHFLALSSGTEQDCFSLRGVEKQSVF